jgi:hypothetical protein
MNLTKSDYLKYRTCPSYFWLWKHEPYLLPQDTDEDVLTRRFEQGEEVEAIARRLFTNATFISSFAEQGQLDTKSAIKVGADIIFQATVLTERGLYARADVLKRNGNTWELFEVKSTSNLDKKKHLPDAAFQRFAFEEAGYEISKVHIIYLNKDYCQRTDILRPHEIFIVEDVSGAIEQLLPVVHTEVSHAFNLTISDTRPTTCPCRFKSSSNQCATFKLFNPEVPAYSIYNIARLNGNKLTELVESGVLNVADVPDDFPLSENQRIQVSVEKSGLKSINKHAMRSELDSLQFPLYFLDYESVNPALPFMAGGKPYQQIVFQYSLHTLESSNAELKHAEYLSRDGSIDKLKLLVQSMRENIGDIGTVIVWNKSFECTRNKEMAELLPEYATFMLGINDRIYDLMDIFAKNYYVDPGFHGSNSIKKVLPILAPELSYKDLIIGKGDIASLRWFEAAIVKNRPDADQIFDDLLKYCELDTYAMVVILRVLFEVAQTIDLSSTLMPDINPDLEIARHY